MKTIAFVLIVGLIALAAILPASAAGHGGNGKMFKTGPAPQDGSGIRNGGGQNGQMGVSGTCIHENCPNNGTPLHDGTGIRNGGGQNGQMGVSGTCIHENCPNNGTPLKDGTGLQYGKGQGT